MQDAANGVVGDDDDNDNDDDADEDDEDDEDDGEKVPPVRPSRCSFTLPAYIVQRNVIQQVAHRTSLDEMSTDDSYSVTYLETLSAESANQNSASKNGDTIVQCRACAICFKSTKVCMAHEKGTAHIEKVNLIEAELEADTEVEEEEGRPINAVFHCMACNKYFKSQKACHNHEKSKRHKENFK